MLLSSRPCSVFMLCSDAQSTKVKLYMLDMTSCLLQEGETISQAVLDTILINIIDPIKVHKYCVLLKFVIHLHVA